MTSAEVASIALMIARMLASRFAWLSTTPLGSPVLPDVYWIKAVAAGSPMVGSAVCAWPCVRVPTLSIELSDGTSPRSRLASRKRLRNSHENPRLGIPQYSGLTAQIVLELRQLHRRIDRNRHGTGVENAEKRREEFRAGRQHEGNAIARRDVARNQPGRDRPGRFGQLAVSHGGDDGALVLQNGHVQAVRIARDMPFQDLDQRLGLRGGGDGRPACGHDTERPARRRVWAACSSAARISPTVSASPMMLTGRRTRNTRSIRMTSSVRPRLSMPRSRSSRLERR